MCSSLCAQLKKGKEEKDEAAKGPSALVCVCVCVYVCVCGCGYQKKPLLTPTRARPSLSLSLLVRWSVDAAAVSAHTCAAICVPCGA